MSFLYKKAEKGISLHRINYVLAALSILCSLLFLLTAYQISDGYAALRRATQEYSDLRDSAYELRDASDYLTDQVRSFAVTGDRAYLDNYFKEALESRRRDAALERLRNGGETSAAYQRLERAMEESVELMDTEYRSMRLTALAAGIDPAGLPEEVQNAPLSEEALALSSEEQRELARSLVLNEEYREKKADISRNMRSCLAELMQEMTHREAEAGNNLHNLIARLQIMVLGLIALVFVRILLTSRLVIGPLLTGVLYIQEGQQLPIRGAYELRFLARTYNQMYEKTRAQTEQLAFDASHDKLTGAYNRSGYEHLMNSTDLGGAALMLVDVDKFKEVNDTYGHQVGDKALIRVTDALRHSFRNDAHICRIGGDEFAVILPGTGPESQSVIERKIHQLNRRLRRSGPDQPSLSVSVGCAFGGAKNGSGKLDKDADVALYRVKENGRCGCAFY